MSTPRSRVGVWVRSGKRSLEEAVPKTTRVVEGNVHRRSRQAKAAVREQRAIARVLVDSPAAHLRGDRRGLVAKCDRGKPHKKCQRWDGCDEANVGRERASGEHVASARVLKFCRMGFYWDNDVNPGSSLVRC